MTNGEKIQQDFACEVCEPIIEDDIIHVIFADKKDSAIGFDWSWWSAEYKEPITKNDLPQTMEELFIYLTDKIPSWKVILIDKWTDFKVWLWIKTHKGADKWE